MSLTLSVASDLSDLDADFAQACDKLKHLIPASIPATIRSTLWSDPAYLAAMKQIRSSCIDVLSGTHSHLLDRNLNQWVAAANQALAEQETGRRIAFHKFDIRRKVKPGFGLEFGRMDALHDLHDPYMQVFKTRSLPLAFVVAGLITWSVVAGPIRSSLVTTLLASIALVGSGGLLQYAFNKSHKNNQLQQLSGLIDELCQQQKQQSAKQIEQARQRFEQVFADYCNQPGIIE